MAYPGPLGSSPLLSGSGLSCCLFGSLFNWCGLLFRSVYFRANRCHRLPDLTLPQYHGGTSRQIQGNSGSAVFIHLHRIGTMVDLAPAAILPIVSGESDLVIGAVLIPGAVAPKLVRKDDLKLMKPGAVIVDVAIDQGGCIETSHATTHTDPIFEVDGIVHYCVANMPGAVARTSTQALANATLPYGLKIAKMGAEAACKADKGLMQGLNTYNGKVTFKGVSDAFGMEYVEPETALA